MSSTFVNPTKVVAESLRQLKNESVMGKLVFRGYEDEFQSRVGSWKIGSSITIKAPVYFRVQDGATINTVDLVERSTTFTISYRKHVAYPITSSEMTLNIDKFTERFIRPAMQALGNYIDLSILGLYAQIPNQVGTPGTTPADFYTFASAQAVLAEEACPEDNRWSVVDPWAQAKMADSFKGLFAMDKVRQSINKGSMGGMLAGFDMYTSNNVNTHTCGTAAGLTTNLKFGASSEGDTTVAIDQNGSWSNTVTAGDIFTIAGVNSVNPITGESTGRLRQFVITTAADDTGNSTALACTPGSSPYAIYSADAAKNYLPYQNVDALPADNAAVSIAGTASLAHKVNLAAHKDCLGLAMVPLEMPASAPWGAQDSYDGYTIRVIRFYDGINDQEYVRFDVLFGLKVLNPFLGCRIAG